MSRISEIEAEALDPDRHDDAADQEKSRCSCPYNFEGECMWKVGTSSPEVCYLKAMSMNEAIAATAKERAESALEGQAAIDEAHNEIGRLRAEQREFIRRVGQLAVERERLENRIADLRKQIGNEPGPVKELREAIDEVVCGD